MTSARPPHRDGGGAPPDYLPGMGRHSLLALYDPLVRVLGKRVVDDELVRQADLRSGQKVLDLGCGTGTVTLRAARSAPAAEVHGLDPDPRALARARRKSERAGLPVTWERGYSQELPYPDGTFDRILSSFMLHHLAPPDRDQTLAQARRVLAPDGSLHIVDFTGAAAEGSHGGHGGHGHGGHGHGHGGHGHGHGLGRRRYLHTRLHDQLQSADTDGVEAALDRAGFRDVELTGRRSVHLLGQVTFYRAR